MINGPISREAWKMEVGDFLVVVVDVVVGCEHEGVPVMLNLILLQTKESFTNDFVLVPNEKKVTSPFLGGEGGSRLFCILRNESRAEGGEKNIFIFLVRLLRFQIEPNILYASQ